MTGECLTTTVGKVSNEEAALKNEIPRTEFHVSFGSRKYHGQ